MFFLRFKIRKLRTDFDGKTQAARGALIDQPIPKDLDGRVLTEIFEEESEFTKRKIKFVKPEKVRIREGIKKLRKAGKI